MLPEFWVKLEWKAGHIKDAGTNFSKDKENRLVSNQIFHSPSLNQSIRIWINVFVSELKKKKKQKSK